MITAMNRRTSERILQGFILKGLQQKCDKGSFLPRPELSVGNQRQKTVKLPAHMAGLPGEEVSFILCPLTPPIPLWRDGARSGQKTSSFSSLWVLICYRSL